jgi:phage protein D
MQPKLKILADKADITGLLNGRLLSLSITDEIGLVSDFLTLELNDHDACARNSAAWCGDGSFPRLRRAFLNGKAYS